MQQDENLPLPSSSLRSSSLCLASLSMLPNEIYLQIFSFAINPFCLIGSIANIRHVNKCWFSLTESEFFWKEIVVGLLRQRMIGDGDENNLELISPKDATEWLFRKATPYGTTFEQLDLYSDDEFDEYMHDLSSRYHKTHEFVDELLESTRKSRNSTKNDCWKRDIDEDANNEEEEVDVEEFYQSPTIFDKSKEWIDSFGEDDNRGNVLLHAYLEIVLGHEMVDHFGMKVAGTFIQQFFLKLFEPAIKLVKSWNETGYKSDVVELKNTSILNRNLLSFIKENGRSSKLFKQKITTNWTLFDDYYSTIPRQYLLFMAEHFSKVSVKYEHNQEVYEMNAVKYVCKSLNDCGLKIEDLCFVGDCLIPNFEFTDGLRRIIRPGTLAFLLPHLAVWTENYELLDWVLTSKNKYGDTTMYQMIVSTLSEHLNSEQMAHIDRVIPKDLTVKSYILAHLSPPILKSYILNEAIMMNNVDMVRHLTDKYLCNPFGPWLYKYSSPLQYALMQSMNASLSKHNNEHKIVDILESKYGESENYKTELEIAKRLSQQERKPSERCSLHHETDEKALAYEKKYGGVYTPHAEYEDFEPDVMKWNVVLEQEAGSFIDKYGDDDEPYNGTESDESGSEECMSLSWVRKLVKNKKRKRVSNDPNIDCARKEEELMRAISGIVSNFESVKQHIDVAEDFNVKVESLNRKWDYNKRIKLDEDAPNENFVITRDSLCFSKLNFREVVQKVLRETKTDVFLSPHAKMLVQQAAEDFISQYIYKINNEMTYGEPADHQIPVANKACASEILTNMYYRYHAIRSCDIHDQLSTFCFGKNKLVFREIVKHLVDLIEDEEKVEDEEDLDYPCDHISVNSDDSLTSCTALQFGECESQGGIFRMNKFMVYTDLEGKHSWTTHTGDDGFERNTSTEVHENTKYHLVTTNDTDLAVFWADNITPDGSGGIASDYETKLLVEQLNKGKSTL